MGAVIGKELDQLSTMAFHDPRLTCIGGVLRKYKIDGLPRLLTVTSVDMSLVRLRPQVERYARLYSDLHREVLSLCPGMADYASIRFVNLDQLLGDGDADQRYRVEIEPGNNRLRLEHVRKMSSRRDLRDVPATLLEV